jgi:hypothetical protein
MNTCGNSNVILMFFCRSKLSVLEMIGKYTMFGFSGSWGIMLAKTVLDRVDKVEAELKEVNIDVNALKVSMAIAEEKSRHHRQEVDAKCDKLRLEVKDLLLAHGFKNKEVPDATVAVPGAQETA